MGVPKFYRWLSERYPCINENVNQYNMPEFDNFYVDMNGVFHICSHPSDDVHFRIPEKQIFENIATYVSFLFNLVQPRKVFFLSVDGVAPRSKMNQQRSRRFKSAKEAIEKETKAKQMGESLPSDPRFDSNCITPGTEFMDKLHSFMIEFIAKKIQNYQDWKEVEIIYSGYDVPGEGEHKIMDYIRYCKTQNLFDPDTRHCLYGLDADLINLGLSTHEPYFSVLREEVSFGRNKQRHCDPIRTNFQLLHLSLLRSYIYHEFQELEAKISFQFNLEKIIDDWILINFLVGNDFLPHVPRLHINKNGIQILYDSYKAVLPTLDGYMNNNGTLVMKRYQKFLQKLSEYDLDWFNQNTMDFRCLDDNNEITFGCGVDMRDDFDFENEENSIDIDDDDDSRTDSDEEEDDDELDDEFKMHKNHYYTTKMKFQDLATDVPKIVEEYIKGIQWVLHYYFDGCVSWNWYYPYHYGPFLSDLAKIDPNIEFHFEMSQPFPPLLQLLAVLPQASKEILPKAFQELTYISDSPLIEYFPSEFETDLNEKIHDYEAIILIPFMDDKLLMETFNNYKNGLTPQEIHRNKFGVHHVLKYYAEPVQNPEEAIDVQRYPNVHDKRIPMSFYVLPREIIYKGVRKNIKLDAVNGFPSFNGINYTVKMEMARIKVFDFASQNVTMMIVVEKKCTTPEILTDMAENYVDKIIYINWPLLAEAKLIELIDGEHKYSKHRKDVLSPEELRNAEISSRNYCLSMKNKKGVVLEQVEGMVKVLPLQSQRYIVTGGKVKLHKEWSSLPMYVPIDVVICDVAQTYRQMPLYKSLNTVFTKNKSYYLIANPFYGYKADVVKYIARDNLVQANVLVTSEPDFGEIELEYSYIMRENYYTEGKLAMIVKRKLNLPENVIRRLLGSVLTQYDTNKGRVKRFNIGLKLKYKNNFQQYCVPGYSYVNNNEIYYNKKVEPIFIEYHRKFPYVFEMLMRENKPNYELDDMFPDNDDDNDADDNEEEEGGGGGLCKSEKIKKLIEIRDWIESQNFSKITHTLGSAEYVDNCVVEALEERIESHMVLLNEEKTISRKFSPANFYIPEFVLKGNYLPDPKVKFLLFDRIVNVKTCIAPPFGGKGTVIGIYYGNDLLIKNNKDSSAHNDVETTAATTTSTDADDNTDALLSSTIEVLFDEPFDGGLIGRSMKTNVFMMHASWLINISYGSRTTTKKMNSNFKNVYQSIQPVRGQSSSSSSLSNQYNNNTNNNRGFQANTNHHHYNNHHNNNNYNYNTPIQNMNNSNNHQHKEWNEGNLLPPKPANEKQIEEQKFNHSENSPFKALKPSFANVVAEKRSIPQMMVTPMVVPDTIDLPAPTIWLENKNVDHNDMDNTQRIMAKLKIAMNNQNKNPEPIEQSPGTNNIGDEPFNQMISPDVLPSPPVEWILSSKQSNRQKNSAKSVKLSPETPIPTFTILPSKAMAEQQQQQQQQRGGGSSNNQRYNSSIGQQQQHHHHPAVRVWRNSRYQAPHHQNHHHQHQQNYYKNDETNDQQPAANNNYQQPLSNIQSDPTRFVPLVVARNYQHENVLRRQNPNNSG